MAVDLEALDAALESTTLTLLGDTITYTPFGGVAATLKALVDYSGGEQMLGSSKVEKDDIAVEVPMTAVPQWRSGDVITLPKTGIDYQPRQVRLDKSGLNWLMILKRKPL